MSGGDRRTRRVRGALAAAIGIIAVVGVAAGCSSDDGGSETATSERTEAAGAPYPIVGTNQTRCYDDSTQIACPTAGEAFFGQNGNDPGVTPAYVDNGDGTITDTNTGLMWLQDPVGKADYAELVSDAESSRVGGHDDWRVPTIKELYSLIEFSGVDASSYSGDDTSVLTPFLDTDYFGFEYGAQSTGGGGGATSQPGGRIIDAQYATTAIYKSTVTLGNGTFECFFGVNFADGRIKCYPTDNGSGSGFYARYVRGDSGYGKTDLTDNGDGTVTDATSGLTWQQDDSGRGLDWESSLSYCQDLEVAGQEDWRLPDAKELQGIVDYSRSPDTTSSAAIDPVFTTSTITNEAGETDFPAFWTSTTHVSYPDDAGNAAYVTFGRALGYIDGSWVDVHGAGAQRSDPKTGDASEFPQGHGPQGDAIRIDNYARCVRGDAAAS